MRFFDTPRPRVFGHRGAAGIAPENTLPAFEAAIRDGAAILEMDVHASRDGEIVVIHDETLERTTDGHGLVRAHTLAELKRLDAGYGFRDADGKATFRGEGVRIPTLREVIEAFPAAAYNIEIKQVDPAIEATVVAVLDACGAADRVLLAASEHAIMTRIRALVGARIPTGMSAIEVGEFLVRSATGAFDDYRPPGAALQVPPVHEGMTIVSEQTVACAHEVGLEVHVWTINDECEMDRLLDLGVDGIMTDFPARLTAVLQRRARR